MRDDRVETIADQFKNPLFSEAAAIFKAGVSAGYWSVMKTGDATNAVLTPSGNFENAESIIRNFVERGLADYVGKKKTGSDQYSPTQKARNVVALL